MIWSSTKKQKPRRNTRWVEYKSEEHSKKFEILVDVQLLIQVLPNTNLVHYSNSLWNICVHAVMYIRRWPFFKILILPVIPNYISFCFDWITDIFFLNIEQFGKFKLSRKFIWFLSKCKRRSNSSLLVISPCIRCGWWLTYNLTDNSLQTLHFISLRGRIKFKWRVTIGALRNGLFQVYFKFILNVFYTDLFFKNKLFQNKSITDLS